MRSFEPKGTKQTFCHYSERTLEERLERKELECQYLNDVLADVYSKMMALNEEVEALRNAASFLNSCIPKDNGHT